MGPVNPCYPVCVALRRYDEKPNHLGGKCCKDFAGDLAKQSPWSRALGCFAALTVTTVIEACVGTVVANYTDTIRVIPLLTSFIGIISAVSGNIGLIASAATIRALQAGHMKPLGRNDWPWALLFNKEWVKSYLSTLVMALYTAL